MVSEFEPLASKHTVMMLERRAERLSQTPSSSSSTPVVPHPASGLNVARKSRVPSSRRIRSIVVSDASVSSRRSFRTSQEVELIREQLSRSYAGLSYQNSTSTFPVPSTSDPAPTLENWHPSQGWRPLPHHLDKQQLWARLRDEAQVDANSEPALASFLYSTILSHSSLERSVSFLLANKLSSPTLLGTQLMTLFEQAFQDEPSLTDSIVADLHAVYDRDPACDTYVQALLYFKGFQAVQCHRIGHHLWKRGRKSLALAIQSRISEVFHVDIHPAAQLGRGILMDHATGVVIGETVVVGDNVSMLHHVTLGGSGAGKGIRHPTVGHGVLLGAGVSVLGPIMVGAGSKVGAGSVVVNDLPEHCVAVGVPAKVIKRDKLSEPCRNMDQIHDFILDYVI